VERLNGDYGTQADGKGNVKKDKELSSGFEEIPSVSQHSPSEAPAVTAAPIQPSSASIASSEEFQKESKTFRESISKLTRQ